MQISELGKRASTGEPILRSEALAVLATPDEEILDVVAAASKPRFAFFGNRVRVNFLVNLKSGLCPEDCFYCSQRLGSDADILKYSWLPVDEAVATAKAGIAAGAARVCLVASGTGPSNREVGKIADITRAIKTAHPDVEICACAGFLKDGQADSLAESGVDAYNHNLNTARSHYAEICTTHTYDDRVDTVGKARGAGISPCSGFIAGMGETHEQLVDLAYELRDLGADSIPVNFLLPFDGTPLKGTNQLTAHDCLRILAMVRLANPSSEVRIAAGRELHLRSMQALGLHIANSIFLGDYLTSEGQPGQEDLDMIADAGMVVDGMRPHRADKAAELVTRRRGAGTTVRPNA
ncbi:biotin synthase BioB [Amycolatopsis sp. CA-230715]|uniref:biotin synthase BioB n=1 Tax=Amycolatopsis sp. CA-230715 TaxID=2745196 RepID=UPI001C0283EE|nr:biotin synthase BioB [Amycolatopsis sp. CA-230715]QWF78904.1 Biotin synthase [Amycolatopsis sp. CA-230715]